MSIIKFSAQKSALSDAENIVVSAKEELIYETCITASSFNSNFTAVRIAADLHFSFSGLNRS